MQRLVIALEFEQAVDGPDQFGGEIERRVLHDCHFFEVAQTIDRPWTFADEDSLNDGARPALGNPFHAGLRVDEMGERGIAGRKAGDVRPNGLLTVGEFHGKVSLLW